MSSEDGGKPVRRVGRPEKPLSSGGGPRPLLAQELRDLRKACGVPTLTVLAAYANTDHRRLAEAARDGALPSWQVVEGYVQGCWEHFKDKHHRPFADVGDMAHWQQLYRKAGGSLPEERRPESTNRNAAPGPIADSETPEPPAGQLPPAQPTAFPQPPRNHHRRTTRLITGVAAALTFLMLGVLAGTHIAASQRSGSSQNPLTRSTPGQPHIRVFVTAPSPTCGLMAQDGLRSPATTGFSNVTQVISVGLDSVSAAIMQGTFNGTVYDWLVSHPAGTRAGIQLRWERIHPPARS